MCQCLGDGSFSHARLTDEARVVFLTAAQDLDHTGKLALAPHDSIQFSVCRTACEVGTISIEELPLFTFTVLFILGRLLLFLFGRGCGSRGFAAKQLTEVDSGCTALGIRLVVFHHLGNAVLHLHQLFGRNAHFIHIIAQEVAQRQSHLFGAFHANAIVDSFAIFQFGHKDDGNSFMTS